MLALWGISFLTPIDALFVLAAALPLAAWLYGERRAERIRRALAVLGPPRRAALPVVVALVLVPALVAVAAAQPVVVRERMVEERDDAQAFFVLDTSLSMRAAAAPGAPTRIARARRLAMRLQRSLGDVPVGLASMTDRSLPNLMPTTDAALFDRTLEQAIAVDQPPPSQIYADRATTFDALIPLVDSHFFGQNVQRRLLVVFTDGESSTISPLLRYSFHRRVTCVFVHVWSAGERIFRAGKADPRYIADPTSSRELAEVAAITGGRVFAESDFGAIARASRKAVGRASTQSRIHSYARIALAPWFVLGGVAPLGLLLWRRNL